MYTLPVCTTQNTPLEDGSSSLHHRSLIWIHERGKKNKNNPHLQFHCIQVMRDTFSLINSVMCDGKTADHFFLLEARLNTFVYEKSPIFPKWWTTGHCLVGVFSFFCTPDKVTQSYWSLPGKNVRNFVYFMATERRGNTSHTRLHTL